MLHVADCRLKNLLALKYMLLVLLLLLIQVHVQADGNCFAFTTRTRYGSGNFSARPPDGLLLLMFADYFVHKIAACMNCFIL